MDDDEEQYWEKDTEPPDSFVPAVAKDELREVCLGYMLLKDDVLTPNTNCDLLWNRTKLVAVWLAFQSLWTMMMMTNRLVF